MDSSKKGYVSSPDSKGAAPVLVTAANNAAVTDISLGVGEAATIRWNAVTLAKDKTFRTYITGVRVQDDGRCTSVHCTIASGSGEL